MFALKNTTGKLTNANVKPELHGDEPVPAQYLHIECDLPNTILDQFDPLLLPMFYKAGDQGELDGNLPSLRLSLISSEQAIKYEGMGYKISIESGIDDSSAIKLKECKVDNIKVDMKEGGTVKLMFRISTKTEEATSGRLDYMQQTEIKFTLTPPSKGELEAMSKAAEKGKQESLVE